MTLWGPTWKQTVPEGLHSMEGTHAMSHEELQPVEGIYVGEVCGGLTSDLVGNKLN